MQQIKKMDMRATEIQVEWLFQQFTMESHCFFLDSNMVDPVLGRYSFLGSNPVSIHEFSEGMKDPFRVLRALLSEENERLESPMETPTPIPFTGGFVGYLSYDLGRFSEKLPTKAVKDLDVPYFWFGRYDHFVAFDHVVDQVYLVYRTDQQERQLRKLVESAREKKLGEKSHIEGPVADLVGGGDSTESFLSPAKEAVSAIYEKSSEGERRDAAAAELLGLKSNFRREDYMDSINRVREYIRAGDVYQINMTQRFAMKNLRSPEDLYCELRRRNSSPFAGYLDFSDERQTRHILSSSPERLLCYRDGYGESRPIKGTLPRGRTPEEDIRLAKTLENSEKDRSELLMIVDLVRNDFGKVAKPGTVKVPQLFHVEHYATVHHLVASVTCELDAGKTSIDLLEGVFPGGSITGAPKIRAMEIIDELEPTRRNIYTGSLGYINENGDMDFNILIRTILKWDEMAYYQVGGGIVWDSDPSAEYDETLHKGKAILRTLTGL